MGHYQFIFDQPEATQREVLIAMLSDIGFTGFEETDDALNAFVNKNDFDQGQFDGVIMDIGVRYTRSEIQDTNWNAEWESAFEPVTVFYPGTTKPFVHIRAGFHNPFSAADHELLITPKMSFGTGHHATTYLVAEQMSRIGFSDAKVIDFGTGTGVLAILAEKLGAISVTAIDNDDWSIENAAENIRTNNCERISLVKAESIPAGEKASVILANINLNIIIGNLAAIRNACEPGGKALFSGILKDDHEKITKALADNDFAVEDILHLNGWIAVLAALRVNL